MEKDNKILEWIAFIVIILGYLITDASLIHPEFAFPYYGGTNFVFVLLICIAICSPFIFINYIFKRFCPAKRREIIAYSLAIILVVLRLSVELGLNHAYSFYLNSDFNRNVLTPGLTFVRWYFEYNFPFDFFILCTVINLFLVKNYSVPPKEQLSVETRPYPEKNELKWFAVIFSLLVYYFISSFLLEFVTPEVGEYDNVTISLLFIFLQIVLISSTFVVIKFIFKKLCPSETSKKVANFLGVVILIFILEEEIGEYREMFLLNFRHHEDNIDPYTFFSRWYFRDHLHFIVFALFFSMNLFMIKNLGTHKILVGKPESSTALIE